MVDADRLELAHIDATMIITFWITGFVFVAVVSFMAYCVFRFRHVEGRTAAYQPESKKLELWLMIGTALGVAAMLAPGLLVWKSFINPPPGDDHRRGGGPAMAVEFPACPEKTGGSASPTHDSSTPSNPLGLNPSTPTPRTTCW